jgi:hypothetical protein
MTLSAGRFWAELQRDEYTPVIPRDVQIAAVDALLAMDALDLAPMLLAPLSERKP